MTTLQNIRHGAFPLLLTLLFALCGANVWGQEKICYETGFESSEGFTVPSNQSYNNSTDKLFGPSDKQWNVISGSITKTKNEFISGDQSLQMRTYSGKNFQPYAEMRFDLEKVTKVEFTVKGTTLNKSVKLLYSTDSGKQWQDSQTFSLNGNVQTLSYSFSTAQDKVRFRFSVETFNVNNGKITLDDVKIYSSNETTPPTTSVPNPRFLQKN